ncbi:MULTISPECIES: hypothetical protein [Hansschlegelia]|uniref:Uncharacterized protein n=1 Tax=Hansschlegelia zhihuaiae TaxID=405005 RepID=A0A4Q0MDL2_9HYPH|nr:hypothetical protein [Hansschlegelia zhihuaiae]RXF71480.1 hypothetical protein EK403_15535 [Hansschlegelia zhihuaiae]
MAADENDFMAALARLEAGRPTNRALIQRAARGRLKINIVSVAIEAGHSRTLIGHAGCRFPAARTAILASMARVKKSPAGRVTALDAIKALRETNGELEAENRLLATKLVEAMGVVTKLRERHQIELRRLEGRLRNQSAVDGAARA